MPAYRIISEADTAAPHRHSRGESLTRTKRVITLVEADSLAEAVETARTTQPHEARRIISVEELHPGFEISDEQILETLREYDIEPGDLPPGSLYDSFDFEDYVEKIALALCDSGLIPGLDISIVRGPDSYAMVEVRDKGRNVYVSRCSETKHLTQDRDASGQNGLLAIARELIALSNDLH